MVGIYLLMFALCLLFTAYRLPLFAGTISFSIHPPKEKIVLGTPFTLEFESLHPEGFSLSLDTTSIIQPSAYGDRALSRGSAASEGSKEAAEGLEEVPVPNKSMDAGQPVFEILEINRHPPEIKARGVSEKISLKVMPFDVGVATFPSLSWIVTAPAGGSGTPQRRVSSPSLLIKIAGVVPPTGGKGDIQDIRPPVNPFPWTMLIAVILMLTAGIALLIYLTRRKRPWELPQTVRDDRPPDAAALEELDRLVSSQLWEQGRFREFYNRLSDILRFYIFRRMGIPAMFMTTLDLCRRLRGRDQGIEIISSVRQCLESCDLVKFAKSTPSINNRDRDCDAVRRLINRTSPSILPVQAGQTGQAVAEVKK